MDLFVEIPSKVEGVIVWKAHKKQDILHNTQSLFTVCALSDRKDISSKYWRGLSWCGITE